MDATCVSKCMHFEDNTSYAQHSAAHTMQGHSADIAENHVLGNLTPKPVQSCTDKHTYIQTYIY